jgi:hypothetical protein
MPTHRPHRLTSLVNQWLTLCIAAALLAAALPTSAYAQSGSGWSPLAPGIDYQVFEGVSGTSDPVHVARMDRSNPNVILDTMIASGYIQVGSPGLNYWTGRGIEEQSQFYNDTINTWGDLSSGGSQYWGNRSKVVVAINGDLWDTSSFIPQQGLVESGWYNWRFNLFSSSVEDRSGFVWTMDREAFIGGCVQQPADEQTVLFDVDNPLPDNIVKIEGVNVARDSEKLYLYTPQYDLYADQTKPQTSASVEVVVQMSRPTTIYPAGDTLVSDIITGTVIDIRTDVASTPENPHDYGPPPAPIGFDQVILSGYGNAAGKLFTKAHIDQIVGFNSQILDNDPTQQNCLTPTDKSWTNTYAAVGVDETLVTNGQVVSNLSTVSEPKSAIAFDDNYLYFITAEGHPLFNNSGNPSGRAGISLHNLAVFIANVLHAQWAVNMDGGGSSTMAINGKSVTHTTDFIYCPQMYTPAIFGPTQAQIRTPAAESSTPEDAGPTPQYDRTSWNPYFNHSIAEPDGLAVSDQFPEYYNYGSSCNRRVPNGIAMIVVEPQETSTNFNPLDVVITPRSLQVHQGPGNNYGVFGTLPGGTLTQIVDPGNTLNGVYATGHYGWYVEFGDLKGWVQEDKIILYTLSYHRNPDGTLSPGG